MRVLQQQRKIRKNKSFNVKVQWFLCFCFVLCRWDSQRWRFFIFFYFWSFSFFFNLFWGLVARKGGFRKLGPLTMSKDLVVLLKQNIFKFAPVKSLSRQTRAITAAKPTVVLTEVNKWMFKNPQFQRLQKKHWSTMGTWRHFLNPSNFQISRKHSVHLYLNEKILWRALFHVSHREKAMRLHDKLNKHKK